MYYLDKKDKLNLSKHLKHKEFKCKCSYEDCTHTLVQQETIDNYERVRADYNAPLRVTSGYRCQRHNKNVGGVASSFHKLGVAIDLQPMDKSPKEEFNRNLDRLEEIARQYFRFVKRYNTFIHCH